MAEIAVIGAGVIGLAVARRLADEGRAVVIIAPDDPVRTSEGNAGVIADYAVMPVGSPEVLRALPSLLLDPASPLAVRRAALPALAPWLARFLWQSLPGNAARNAAAIAALMAEALADWRALAARIGGHDLLRTNGMLYLYDTAADRRGAEAAMAARRALGVQVELIGAAELGQLEPRLPPMPHGAAFFPQAAALSCPGEMMARLRAACDDIPRHSAAVTGLVRAGGGVRLTLSDGAVVAVRRAVIAAGAWSRGLARMAGDRVPLDTERGYHLEYDIAPPVVRPVTPLSRGVYLSPMAGRLRVAGTVELGGLGAPPSPLRLAKLDEGARTLFPDLPRPAREWMGFRPSVPDSVPVIGPSRAGGEVVLAFGHGHVGLTLAPRTARMVADLLAGRHPGVDPAPYAPSRF